MLNYLKQATIFFIILFVSSCSSKELIPLRSVNNSLRQSSLSHNSSTLSNNLLGTIAKREDRQIIELINIRNRKRLSLVELNRSYSKPISISISNDGEILVAVVKRNEETLLLLYRRKTGLVKRLIISPTGTPQKVSLNSKGNILAVQVNRSGRWDIDLIEIPR